VPIENLAYVGCRVEGFVDCDGNFVVVVSAITDVKCADSPVAEWGRITNFFLIVFLRCVWVRKPQKFIIRLNHVIRIRSCWDVIKKHVVDVI